MGRCGGQGDLLRSLDDALARLDTDYVDLWLVEPRDEVPLAETLEAASVAYRSGRARYVGLSRASHWQLAEAVTRGEIGASAPISAVEFPFSSRTPSVHPRSPSSHREEWE